MVGAVPVCPPVSPCKGASIGSGRASCVMHKHFYAWKRHLCGWGTCHLRMEMPPLRVGNVPFTDGNAAARTFGRAHRRRPYHFSCGSVSQGWRNRLCRWTKTRKGRRKRLRRWTKTRKGCRKRLRQWTKSKMIAGRGSADGLKQEKVGGRGSADGLKQEKGAGRGSADGLKRKRLPEEAPPTDKNKKRSPEEAPPMDKNEEGCVAEGRDGDW